MSKIKDFKDATLGATATSSDGVRAMRINDGGLRWITRGGSRLDDEEMERWAYTLDAPAPTTALEALVLAWDLAHEVEEGQVIPAYGRTIGLYDSGDLYLERVGRARTVSLGEATFLRTFDPLPEPDWLDAPAVFAHCGYCSHEDCGPQRTLHRTVLDGQKWECTECQTAMSWRALTDVTPLYPLSEGTEDGTTAPKGYIPSNSMGLKNKENTK